MAEIKKRVFLDANILFTACYNPLGLAYHLITNKNYFTSLWIMSDYAFHEAEYNLQIKKPDSFEHLIVLKKSIEVTAVPLYKEYNPLKLPDSDIPILQGALATQCTHLLTGDKKAFGPWMNKPKKTFGIIIQSVRQFVDEHD